MQRFIKCKRAIAAQRGGENGRQSNCCCTVNQLAVRSEDIWLHVWLVLCCLIHPRRTSRDILFLFLVHPNSNAWRISLRNVLIYIEYWRSDGIWQQNRLDQDGQREATCWSLDGQFAYEKPEMTRSTATKQTRTGDSLTSKSGINSLY